MKTTPALLSSLATLSLLAACANPSPTPPAPAPTPAPVTPSVVATGFNGPQGVYVAGGNVWVSDDGTGGTESFTAPTPTGDTGTGSYGDTARLVRVAPDGAQSVVTTLLSVSPPGIGPTGGGKIAVIGDTMYVTDGIWNAGYSIPRVPKAGSVLRVEGGATTEVADLFAFDEANNPDGVPAAEGGIDSHPYGLAAGPDGLLYVADAGGNDLLKVDPATGAVSLVASLAGRTGTGAQSVPTGVTFGADGAVYVSLLGGFPYPDGVSRVVKVVDGEVTDFATGLNLLTDVTLGPDGNLYAVSFGTADVDAELPYVANSGSLVRIGADGQWGTVVDEINFPTAIAFNAAGDAYVTQNGLGAPGSGQLVKYAELTRYAEQ